MSLSGNIGEWSEVYTLLKLAGNKRVYAADANLQRIENLFYPILEIIRSEREETYHYNLKSKIIIRNSDDKVLDEFSFEEFTLKAVELFEGLKTLDKTKKIPSLDSFLEKIHCHKLSAKSKEKRDLTLVVHDPITQHKPSLGFSIKSRLGAAATLINSTIGTNFEFEIINCSLNDDLINRINSDIDPVKGKIQRRYQSIIDLGGELKFNQIIEKTFSQNLTVIDSNLPLIISHCLKLYYSGTCRKVSEMVEYLNKENPCNYSLTEQHPFYQYKLKRLLYDSALGMVPATPWKGVIDATGGYLVVKEDGEILCYHVYNENDFQEQLYQNSYFDTPSSTKHKFATIYERDNKYYIRLNIQVKFK